VPEFATSLDVPLRGEREYAHSTDIHAAIDKLAKSRFGPAAYLQKLVLRRPSFRQVSAQFHPAANAIGTFHIKGDDALYEGWLTETDAPISRRIAFDEAPIQRAALHDHNRVWQPHTVADYSVFEQAIVLLKILCAQIHPGTWAFTMIELAEPLEEGVALELSMQQSMLSRGIIAGLHQEGQMRGQALMALANLEAQRA
jgi:hypothetical protein